MAGLTNSVLYLASSFWQLLLDVFSVNLLWQKKFSPPSSETAARVQGINSLLRKERVSDSAIDLVSDLPITEDLLAVTDLSGYNLLQLAVMREDTQTVRWLLRLGFDPDICNCSSAIQIAARNGHQDIVQVLIEAGAKVDKQRGMCYVKPHVPIMFRANYLGLSPHPVYECNSRKKTPLQCAVDGDHVNIVKILYPVLAQKLYDETPPSELMHYACRVGSLKVMQHLVEEWPELAETPDSNGHTPLLLAVPWGQSHTQFLIDSGADLRQRSSLGETVLHRLFRNTKDGYYSIYNTTKFLLTSGMEEDVNVQDYKGETALHNLVGHVSFVLKGGSNFGEEPDDMVQSDYQQEVVECLDLLLSYNADVSVINNQNHQPLSKLMHFAFVTCYPREPHPCIELDPDDHYVNNFDSLNKALQVLLKHGADPNVQCGAGHTSLVLLLQCFLYGSPECCCSQSTKFLNCLETLLSHGAKVNFVTSSEATCSTLLAKIGQRCLQLGREGRRNDVTLQDEFSELLNDCLKLMLRYGLNPNHISTKKSSHLQGGTGNALIEFVRLAEYAAVPRDLAAIHKWIQTLMQWGADPDIEPYPSHPIICHSQSSIFLKKQASQPVSHYIHEAKELKSMFAEGHAMDLLLLFYSTMDHQILYECLRSAKFMSRFHPMGATGQDFLRALNKLTDNPRSLKSTVRVVIYKALNRSLAEKVPELPLPNPLKRYLLEIEL